MNAFSEIPYNINFCSKDVLYLKAKPSDSTKLTFNNMPFNFFKKKIQKPEEERHYDPLNITVTDLRKGFVFEYDLEEWLVEAEYLYDWGNEHISQEFKVTTGTETYYLSVDKEDDLEIGIFEKLKLSAFDVDISGEIVKNQEPPFKLVHENMTFTRESENPGYFKDAQTGGEWEEMIAWNYYDSEEKYSITIEQWGERKFEAAFGKLIQEHEISNILPAST